MNQHLFSENPINWARERLITGQSLLKQGSHFWADQVFTEILERFEKDESIKKKTREYIRDLVIQAWITHANRIYNSKTNWLLICDAYQHIFYLLSQYNKFDQIADILVELIHDLMTLDQVVPETLASLLEAGADMLVEARKMPEALELLMVVMLLRKYAKPTETLTRLFLDLENILLRLRQDYRNALVAILLENAVDFFQVPSAEKPGFIEELNSIVKNVASSGSRDAFLNIFKILSLYENPPELIERWTLVAGKLQDLNEYGWGLRVFQNLLQYFREQGYTREAVDYGRKFITLAIRRQHLQIAFQACQLLAEILEASREFDLLADLWLNLAYEFSQGTHQRHLFNQSIAELEKTLASQQGVHDPRILFEFMEEIWLLKTRVSRASEDEFWAMIVHRAVFEEGDFETGQLALNSVSEKFKKKFHIDLDAQNLSQIIPPKGPRVAEDFPLSVLRLIGDSRIDLYGYSTSEHKFISISMEHSWDDQTLQDIYNRLLLQKEGYSEQIGNSGWCFKDLGRCIYLMLPKPAREMLGRFRVESKKETPSILFLMDNSTIPIDFIHDGTNFLSLKYSTGNKIGEPPMMGIGADDPTGFTKEKNILLIGNFNSSNPRIWDESKQSERILYPFPEAKTTIDDLIAHLNTTENVSQISYLQGDTATKAAIIETLRGGKFHIIYICSNLFFVENNPVESYFLTADNEILSLKEFSATIRESGAKSPLIINDSKILDPTGLVLKNCTHESMLIAHSIEPKGAELGQKAIVIRIADIHTPETTSIIKSFLDYVLRDDISLGKALLKARQDHFAELAVTDAEKFVKSSEEGDLGIIAREGDIVGSSFVLYGFPWTLL